MAFAGQRSDTGLIDAISGLGDPWVAAMNQNDLKRELEGLPRGPGGQPDYNAAALKLMGRHPLAAVQLQRMAAQQQTAGHQSAELALRREALSQQRDLANKPQYKQDDEGDWLCVPARWHRRLRHRRDDRAALRDAATEACRSADARGPGAAVT